MIRRKSREADPPAFPKENSPWEDYERYFQAKSEWNIQHSKRLIDPIGFCNSCVFVTKTKNEIRVIGTCDAGTESFWACVKCGQRAHCSWCKSVVSVQFPVGRGSSLVPNAEGVLSCYGCTRKLQGNSASSRFILLMVVASATLLTAYILFF